MAGPKLPPDTRERIEDVREVIHDSGRVVAALREEEEAAHPESRAHALLLDAENELTWLLERIDLFRESGTLTPTGRTGDGSVALFRTERESLFMRVRPLGSPPYTREIARADFEELTRCLFADAHGADGNEVTATAVTRAKKLKLPENKRHACLSFLCATGVLERLSRNTYRIAQAYRSAPARAAQAAWEMAKDGLERTLR